MKLSIVTPVYHEQDNIQRVLDGLRLHVKTPHEFLVVYDLSDDPTCNVVKKYIKKYPDSSAKLVRTSQGNGRGFMNALKTGFVEAKGDYVLVMMADLCDDPKDIDAMIERLDRGADLVAASRFMKGGKQIGGPWLKRFLSRMAGVSLYRLGCVPIHDVTNNFKMYRRTMLRKLNISEQGGFEIAMELTVKAHRKGYKLDELPTTWRDRDAGEAKFDLKKMVPRYLKWYWFALTNQ